MLLDRADSPCFFSALRNFQDRHGALNNFCELANDKFRGRCLSYESRSIFAFAMEKNGLSPGTRLNCSTAWSRWPSFARQTP